ncbi:hypothetical protein Amir_6134 [Actinosynnema mirum DSM 43827]|uniref:Secreted/membrane protein n=1 Tax=Actinosynnema mirum (strain ATCC 29888 / DSM 43827 / JCM 3225 / NBRC 14064 / NCIMB 13271 / NRRL B-12336 / IMRU 3971 / 101) TaxID=446462 RepID=C6WHJ2_ACTMD|nr:hypothetical protein Amir_6134 [Actinosynnema mirum DSM 43827]AXX33454.1 putative secreted/membrane protein [Actinosynnema pretiosum subsp. pretiosum]
MVGIAEVVGVVLFLAALVLTYTAWRRVRLLRAGGVHVALRSRVEENGRGWQLGVGRYRGDEFAWYRVFSLRAGPDRTIHRSDFEIDTRREPTEPEAYAMPVGARVLRCKTASGEVEIAMGPDALTGFLSWLESAPPGRSIPWAS